MKRIARELELGYPLRALKAHFRRAAGPEPALVLLPILDAPAEAGHVLEPPALLGEPEEMRF